jgi:hypothetical protein
VKEEKAHLWERPHPTSQLQAPHTTSQLESPHTTSQLEGLHTTSQLESPHPTSRLCRGGFAWTYNTPSLGNWAALTACESYSDSL